MYRKHIYANDNLNAHNNMFKIICAVTQKILGC